MKYSSKKFRQKHYFVLYDLSDNIISYFDNYDDLSKILTYELRNLVYQYNYHNSNIITIEIANKKYKLATFID